MSQGRQLGMIKGKETRAERESFPETFLPSSKPREGVEIKEEEGSGLLTSAASKSGFLSGEFVTYLISFITHIFCLVFFSF